MNKYSKQQLKKLSDKFCFFCGEDDYDLLDAHRIIEGGKYEDFNILTNCSNCHRKIHSGRIKILGKHFCSNGNFVIHYIEDEEEKWK